MKHFTNLAHWEFSEAPLDLGRPGRQNLRNRSASPSPTGRPMAFAFNGADFITRIIAAQRTRCAFGLVEGSRAGPGLPPPLLRSPQNRRLDGGQERKNIPLGARFASSAVHWPFQRHAQGRQPAGHCPSPQFRTAHLSFEARSNRLSTCASNSFIHSGISRRNHQFSRLARSYIRSKIPAGKVDKPKPFECSE